jgi:hypothetical protein
VSPAVAQNYTATQGAGTTFGSKLVTAVNYPQIVFCDPTTPANCVGVNASGQITVLGTGTFATQSAITAAASSIAAGAGVDGWDLTQGTKADAAWVSGSGSLIAIAKTIATNTGAAIPASTNRIGYVSDDPCTQLTKTNVGFGVAVGTTQLVAPSGITQVYVCSFSLIAAATAVVNLVGGTGAACTTGTPVAALGSTTAANGMSLAANGGLTFGNGGATVVRTTTAGHGLCLIQSGTTALAGNITYVQQ